LTHHTADIKIAEKCIQLLEEREAAKDQLEKILSSEEAKENENRRRQLHEIENNLRELGALANFTQADN
jgi:uncharacterized Ntn-hydrolase superfamily protein